MMFYNLPNVLLVFACLTKISYTSTFRRLIGLDNELQRFFAKIG